MHRRRDVTVETADAAATVLQRAWRALAAAVAEVARQMEVLEARPLPLLAQVV